MGSPMRERFGKRRDSNAGQMVPHFPIIPLSLMLMVLHHQNPLILLYPENSLCRAYRPLRCLHVR
jgi:hypothetical protein